MPRQTSQTNKSKPIVSQVTKGSSNSTTCKSQAIKSSQLASKTNGQKIIARGEAIPLYIREISHAFREIAATAYPTPTNRGNIRASLTSRNQKDVDFRKRKD